MGQDEITREEHLVQKRRARNKLEREDVEKKTEEKKEQCDKIAPSLGGEA